MKVIFQLDPGEEADVDIAYSIAKFANDQLIPITVDVNNGGYALLRALVDKGIARVVYRDVHVKGR